MTNPDTPTKAVEAPPHFCQAWGSCDYCAICGQAMPVPTGPVATPSPADRAASVGAVPRSVFEQALANLRYLDTGKGRHLTFSEAIEYMEAALATPQALPTPQAERSDTERDAPDNSACKFASGGAPCVSHCGDPTCLRS